MIDNIQYRIVTGIYRQMGNRKIKAVNIKSSRKTKSLCIVLLLLLVGTLLQSSFDVHNEIYHMDGSSVTKTEKCQPAAGDMPDLIQTEHVPSSWLARSKNKNQQNEKYKIQNENYLSDVTMISLDKPTKLFSVGKNTKSRCYVNVLSTKKQQKCQPAAGDMPDLIQTEHVPSSWLARPKNKLNEKKKIQNTNYSSNVTVVSENKLTNQTPVDEIIKCCVNTLSTKKQQKCQPAAGDMPDLIQTEHVPSSWLDAQKIKIN